MGKRLLHDLWTRPEMGMRKGSGMGGWQRSLAKLVMGLTMLIVLPEVDWVSGSLSLKMRSPLLGQPAQALTAQEVEAIAQQITVLIDGLNPGSGVIIGQEQDRYLVLTSRHVVATEDEYWIITPDGREYPVNYESVRPLPGVDLAVVEFQSDRSYTIATLADYPYNEEFPYIFVSGWSGSVILQQPIEPRFSGGLLLRKRFALIQSQDPLARGYDLFYTSITDIGMSGGPVLDTEGRVIGIHGRSEGEEFYEATTDEYTRLRLGFSAGIPIQSFLRLDPQVGLNLPWRVDRRRPNELTTAVLASIEAILEPTPLEDRNNSVDWTNRGNEFYRLERFAQSQDAFEWALQLDPNFYQAWYGLGQVLMAQSRYQDALNAYNRVLELEPEFAKAWRDRAMLYALLEDYSDAATDLDQAVQLDPEDYIAWYLRGNLFRSQMGWYDAALGSYDRTLELVPYFAEAWIGRGRTQAEMSQLSAALESLRRATQIDPDLASGWYWLGRIFFTQGRYTEALQAVERAIAITPEDEEAALLLSRTLLALGQTNAARVALEQLLEQDSGNENAQTLLESLPSPDPTP